MKYNLKEKIKKKFFPSLIGISKILSTDKSVKIQIVFAFFVLLISLLIQVSKYEFILILFVCFFMIFVEILNSSIEKLIDVITLKYHKDFKNIKDIFAGLVLFSGIFSIIIGCIIFYPYVLKFLISFLK